MTITLNYNTPLKDVLKLSPACKCSKCEHGCRYTAGVMVEEDIPKLAKFLNISIQELMDKKLDVIEKFNTQLFRPKLIDTKGFGYGKCIFFDEENKCTIHKAKPLQCRIASGCSDYGEQLNLWFTIKNFVNIGDPESIRQYNVYLKSGGEKIEGASLQELVPDKERLRKILKFEIL